MRFPVLSLALCIGAVEAFRDTSPFFLFSSSEILISSAQIVPAASLGKKIATELQKCLSDIYVLVSQPGVNAADYQSGLSTPHLSQKVLGRDHKIRSSLTVTDVLGQLEVENFSDVIQKACGAELIKVDASSSLALGGDQKPLVIKLDFSALPADDGRASKLMEHDSFLGSMLDRLSSNKYTVIYTTTPLPAEQDLMAAESERYHIDTSFQSPVHMDLKRDFSNHKRSSNSSKTSPNRPLFEKYQFFTPGIFMGILVSILLISILYVGVSGIASLQVSYSAFDKEMGPAAMKKQMQQ